MGATMNDRILTADVDGNRDFVLEGMSCWITVGRAAINIMQSDDGVVVDIYRDGHETEDSIASTWALWNDLKDQEEDDTNAAL